MERVDVELPGHLAAELEAVAETRGVTRDQVVRDRIAAWLWRRG